MPLTTPDQVRQAIMREFDTIREDDPPLPDTVIDEMVNVVLQTPADQREQASSTFVRDTVDRRRGDPRTSDGSVG